MHDMFYGAHSFNQALDHFDVSNVEDFYGVFYEALNFDQPLSSWVTSRATTMEYMFFSAYAFRQDLSMWDVSSVEEFDGMFYGIMSFNVNLSNWVISSGCSFVAMFSGVPDFNQDMNAWGDQLAGKTCPSGKAPDVSYMFHGTSCPVHANPTPGAWCQTAKVKFCLPECLTAAYKSTGCSCGRRRAALCKLTAACKGPFLASGGTMFASKANAFLNRQCPVLRK
jgi:hypothetical protein